MEFSYVPHLILHIPYTLLHFIASCPFIDEETKALVKIACEGHAER